IRAPRPGGARAFGQLDRKSLAPMPIPLTGAWRRRRARGGAARRLLIILEQRAVFLRTLPHARAGYNRSYSHPIEPRSSRSAFVVAPSVTAPAAGARRANIGLDRRASEGLLHLSGPISQRSTRNTP